MKVSIVPEEKTVCIDGYVLPKGATLTFNGSHPAYVAETIYPTTPNETANKAIEKIIQGSKTSSITLYIQYTLTANSFIRYLKEPSSKTVKESKNKRLNRFRVIEFDTVPVKNRKTRKATSKKKKVTKTRRAK